MSAADDLAAVQKVFPVSRETGDRLEAFVALVRKWQPAENLISPNTLPELWRRHVADSAELVRVFPDERRWLDVGTGAGFPGMIVALVGGAGTHVDLVESNRRKCAFLRQAIRVTGAAATVHEGRAEAVIAGWTAPVDRISARAVAPLSNLLELCAPLMAKGVPAGFHKGAEWRGEVDAARQKWEFDLKTHETQSGSGVILAMQGLRLKHESD